MSKGSYNTVNYSNRSSSNYSQNSENILIMPGTYDNEIKEELLLNDRMPRHSTKVMKYSKNLEGFKIKNNHTLEGRKYLAL